MTQAIIMHAVQIVAIICATILALKKREGWGWLIFLVFIIGG